MKTLILIKIILLVNTPFFPTQLQEYLFDRGLKVNFALSRLGDVNLLGNQNLFMNYARIAFKNNPKYLTYVITDRFLGQDNVLYTLGVANANDGVAFGTYADYVYLNEDRLKPNWLVAAHEIGHLLGLGHDGTNECKSIMDANVLSCENWRDVTFLPYQLKLIRKYQRRKIKRRNLTTCFLKGS